MRTKRTLDKLLNMDPERKRQRLDKTVLPNLPKEVWCIIFSSLPKESLKNATSTCKNWFEIIRGDSRLSGSISIPWIEFQNSSLLDNWSSLKTLAITDSAFLSPKMALDAMKAIDFKKCPSLEKVTIDVEFELAELSQEMKEIGTVLGLVFNPQLDIPLFKLEHLDVLGIEMMSQGSDDIERDLKIMKMIGEEAKNIRWLIVGCNSIETLSLNGLMSPLFEKFKNLKRCEISVQEDFEKIFGYTAVTLHTAKLVKDLDEKFADRSTELKLVIRANYKERKEKGYQIVKI